MEILKNLIQMTDMQLIRSEKKMNEKRKNKLNFKAHTLSNCQQNIII